jgi:hypothetical protein
MRPPINEDLARVALYLGAGAVFSGLIFLRALWTWERLKFRARAWMSGRMEARERWRARRRTG